MPTRSLALTLITFVPNCSVTSKVSEEDVTVLPFSRTAARSGNPSRRP